MTALWQHPTVPAGLFCLSARVTEQRWHADKAWLGGDEVVPDVAIEAVDGVISKVEQGVDPLGATKLHGVVVPGLVSAHSHAFHRLLRGKTHGTGTDFWTWREPMYTAAASLTPGAYRRTAEAVFTEMLLAGITTVGEFHYVHHRQDGTPHAEPNAMAMALVDAAQTVGIRLTLLDTAYMASSVYGDPPLPRQRRFSDGTIGAWVERAQMLAADVSQFKTARLGVAAHSVRALSPPQLETVASVGRALEVPIHIHVSEQPEENQECLRAHGVTPIGLLADVGFLGADVTLVHATHASAEDIDLVAAEGARVCMCPTTEADLGDGIGPARELVDAGVDLCLGSDSNAVVDILEEAARLEYHDRLRLLRRGVHSPSGLMRAATENGAAALGWNAGRIAPGYVADFVSLDTESLELSGTDGDISSVAMVATRASVQQAFVDGVEIVLPPPMYEESR